MPGSALAGSLRAHLSQARPPADERLMGSRPPRAQAEAAESTVSPLWIVGSVFTPGSSADQPPGNAAALEITGQTAIDRERGAAARRVAALQPPGRRRRHAHRLPAPRSAADGPAEPATTSS